MFEGTNVLQYLYDASCIFGQDPCLSFMVDDRIFWVEDGYMRACSFLYKWLESVNLILY